MTNINEKTTCIRKEEKNGITQELVKKLFEYKDGFLYWKVRPSNNMHIGDKAGFINSKRRNIVTINWIDYYASRIIFLWHHGWLPEVVDHENRNKNDDNIENLRAATLSENARNTTSRKKSSSQYLGVSFKKINFKYTSKITGVINIFPRERWIASIKFGNLKKEITCKTEIEAALSYNKMAVKFFKEFASLNIIKP